MFRFTIRQMLQAVTLVAILLMLGLSENSRQRFSMIECLSYSRDGTKLLVSRLDSQDAGVSFKSYRANISRAVSVIDAKSGRPLRSVRDELVTGNQGPGRLFWSPGRTSVSFDRASDSIVVQDFGGGQLSIYSPDEKVQIRRPAAQSHMSTSISVCAAGNLVAFGDAETFSVIDLSSGILVNKFATSRAWPANLDLRIAANGRAKLLISGRDRVECWDVSSGKEDYEVHWSRDLYPHIAAMLLDNFNFFIAATGEGLKMYDRDGNVAATFSDADDIQACAISSDQSLVAVSRWKAVEIIDLQSQVKLRDFLLPSTTTLAFSPDASQLAAGHDKGQIMAIDPITGRTVWSAAAPRHTSAFHRETWHWSIPALSLIAWTYATWKLGKRKLAAERIDRASRDSSIQW